MKSGPEGAHTRHGAQRDLTPRSTCPTVACRPGPNWRIAIHFRQPGFAFLPSGLAWIERWATYSAFHRLAYIKTQYFTATSLDGFIATQDDSLDWLFPLGDVKSHQRQDSLEQRQRRFHGIGHFRGGTCAGHRTGHLGEPGLCGSRGGEVGAAVGCHRQ